MASVYRSRQKRHPAGRIYSSAAAAATLWVSPQALWASHNRDACFETLPNLTDH